MSYSPLSTNPIIGRLRSDEFAIGIVVRLVRTPEIARVAASCGYDFLFLDCQHSWFDPETVSAIVQAALGCGIATLVRVRGSRDPNIPVFLDMGASGIVVPDVNDAADAERVVAACKYAPIGNRSVSGPYALFDYRTLPLPDLTVAANAHTLVVCMIESREGLANIDAIGAVPGVDVLLVGCTDMLADMGKPGAFGDPEIMQAVARVGAVARANGKFAGAGGDHDPARQAQFIRDGIRFFSTQSDLGLLLQAGSELVANLRDVHKTSAAPD